MAVKQKGSFAFTGLALRLLERLAACVYMKEPILLVGETGIGKTSVVHFLAEQLGQKLVVQNLNHQSESSDLFGGFKPMDVRLLAQPLLEQFDIAFKKLFSRKVRFV